MSDLLLGTIIGGSIAVIGSVSGLIIQGYYARRTTKMQIDARVEEQREQFKFQEGQAQIQRLVDQRARYLTPMKEYLLSITRPAHHLETMLRDLIFMCRDDHIAWADSRSEKCLDQMQEDAASIIGQLEAIEMLRVQNTDSRLASLLQQVVILGSQVSKEISELRSMNYRHAEGDFTDKPLRQMVPLEWVKPFSVRPSDMNDEPNTQITYQCSHSSEVINALYESLRQSNRRIEEIMSGME
jgi:hypothetical protein